MLRAESFQSLVVKDVYDRTGATPNPGLWVVCTQHQFAGAFVLKIA